jgi:hypothetical protein
VNAPGYRLGIDFGTSNTVAMLAWPDGQVRPLLFDGSPALPSAVYADASSGLLVGRDAAHAARVSPERYEPNPKRRIDEPAVLLGESEVSTVDLIASVLGRVVVEARRVAGGAVGGAVGGATITYPAAWAQTRRGVLVAAAERAGLAPVSLVPEPVAAASVFVGMSGAPVGATFVVYDLGAGTFDATVVRRTADGGFDVLSTEGLPQSGGLDIDAAIVAYLGAVYSTRDPQLWGRLLRPTSTAERRANRLLWEDVRSAKEMLSRASSTMIHIPLADEDAPLGRDQFEQLARPILDATVNATRAAIAAAGLPAGGVSGIFLVGGGSRIPLVATLLHQAFGVAPTVVEQPELVVAQGSLGASASAAAVSGAGPVSGAGSLSGAGPVSGVAAVPGGGPAAPVSGGYPAAPTSGGHAGGYPDPVAPVSGTGAGSVPVSSVPAGPYPPHFAGSGPVSAPPSGLAGPVSAPPGSVSAPPGSVSGPPGSVSAPPGPVSGPPGHTYGAAASVPGRAAVPNTGTPYGEPRPAPNQPGQSNGAGRSNRTGLLVAVAVVAVLLLGLGGFAITQLNKDDPANNTSQGSGDSTDSGADTGDSGDTGGGDRGKAATRPTADYYDEGTDWSTTAEAYNDRIGDAIAFECPASGTPGTVWGSEPFTSDSSVCTAAVHAGWISLEDGGWIKIKMQPGVDSYQGSKQYGIETTDYGPYEWAFSFTG